MFFFVLIMVQSPAAGSNSKFQLYYEFCIANIRLVQPTALLGLHPTYVDASLPDKRMDNNQWKTRLYNRLVYM